MVISCAPARDLTDLVAQRPKAAEPPPLFIRSTMMPSSTRNITMEKSALATMPRSPDAISITVFQGLNWVYSRVPTSTPINREEYTSLLISASTIATTGGSRDQMVPANGVAASTISPSTSKTGSGAPLNVMPSTTSSTTNTPSATRYAILVLFFSIM